MNFATNRLCPVRALATFALFAGAAVAQFPGDFYFTDPTPVFSEGEDVVLQVEVFTGSSPFGAAAVDVAFDVDAFEVLEVRALGVGGAELEVSDIRTVDGHAVAAFFSKPDPAPFGSVTLFEVRGRPRFSGGGTIAVQVEPRKLLDPDGGEPLATGGAGRRRHRRAARAGAGVRRPGRAAGGAVVGRGRRHAAVPAAGRAALPAGRADVVRRDADRRAGADVRSERPAGRRGRLSGRALPRAGRGVRYWMTPPRSTNSALFSCMPFLA